MQNFNSRPCGRGDHRANIHQIRLILFQFTPLREGRPQALAAENQRKIISIHAPAGGATPAPGRAAACWCYFNSRPCGRGDEIKLEFEEYKEISIHAPAGGATVTVNVMNYPQYLFQFTPLREGRRIVPLVARQHLDISIHAPAGGATAKGYKKRK